MKGASLAVFWGKISALKNDYYIVQAQVEGGEEGELLPNVEPKGTGVNEKVYFVTTNRKKNFVKKLSYGRKRMGRITYYNSKSCHTS